MCDRFWYTTWWGYCGSLHSWKWGWTNRRIDLPRSMSYLSSATSMLMPWGHRFCKLRRWKTTKPRRCMTDWHPYLQLTTFQRRRYALLHLLRVMMMLNDVQFTALFVLICGRSSAWTVRPWCSARGKVWQDWTRRSCLSPDKSLCVSNRFQRTHNRKNINMLPS